MNRSTAVAIPALLAVSASVAGAQRLPDPIDPALTVECHSLVPIAKAWETNRFAGGMAIPMDRLGLFARRFVQPAFTEGEDIAVLGDTLLVARGRLEQQAWVQRWLHNIAKSPTRVAEVAVAYFEVTQRDFIDICVPLLLPQHTAQGEGNNQPTPDTDPNSARVTHSAVLAPAARAQLDKAMAKRGGWHSTGHPANALVNEFQRASLVTSTDKSYVAGYKPGPGADNQWLPQVETVAFGSTVDAAATVLPDGGVGLRIVIDYSELFTLEDEAWSPAHPKLRIQQPKVHRYSLAEWSVLPSGNHVAYFALPHPDSDKVLVIAVRTAVAKS